MCESLCWTLFISTILFFVAKDKLYNGSLWPLTRRNNDGAKPGETAGQAWTWPGLQISQKTHIYGYMWKVALSGERSPSVMDQWRIIMVGWLALEKKPQGSLSRGAWRRWARVQGKVRSGLWALQFHLLSFVFQLHLNSYLSHPPSFLPPIFSSPFPKAECRLLLKNNTSLVPFSFFQLCLLHPQKGRGVSRTLNRRREEYTLQGQHFFDHLFAFSTKKLRRGFTQSVLSKQLCQHSRRENCVNTAKSRKKSIWQCIKNASTSVNVKWQVDLVSSEQDKRALLHNVPLSNESIPHCTLPLFQNYTPTPPTK